MDMQGASHTSYTPDPTKKEQWLAEIAARPEITEDQLVGLFSSDFIARIDAEQTRRMNQDDPKAILGFTALEGATKDEARLFEYARDNMGTYEDEVEDLLYDDPILAKLTEPEFRQAHSVYEQFTQAVRLRRTVVAHYLVSMELAQNAVQDSSGKGAA